MHTCDSSKSWVSVKASSKGESAGKILIWTKLFKEMNGFEKIAENLRENIRKTRHLFYLVDHFIQDNRIKSGFAWFLSLFSRAVLRLKHPPKVGPVLVIVMIIVIIGIVVVIYIPKYDLCGSC